MFKHKRRKRRVIWIQFPSLTRLLVSVVMAAFVLLMLSTHWPTTNTWSHWSLPLSGKTIVIDPGHGGTDGGATSKSGLMEKDINLQIGLDLRDYLQEAGALVIMTRETDKDLADANPPGRRKTQDLLRRVALIEEEKADLFISIHLNSITSSRWSGAQTFYYSKNEEGKRLALAVQDELKQQLGNTTREATTADTKYILKATTVPGVIVEAGFLSNPQEAALLADRQYQKKVAASVYQGVLRYLSNEVPASSY